MKRRSTGSSFPDRRAERGARGGRGASHGKEEIRQRTVAVLQAMGIVPSRSWGQNFLVDPRVAEGEAALLHLPPGRAVVEIGGGLGELTRALLERGVRPLTVVEHDPRLVAFLRTNFPRTVTVIEGDALTVPLPHATVFVGNLPFSVSAPILERLWETGMEVGVFLLQEELAERLVSPPGRRSYGPFSVLARVHGEFRIALRVPPEAFHPSPKVKGAIVVFGRRPLSPAPRSLPLLKALLRGAFAWRRKKLRHPLPQVLAQVFHAGGELEGLLEKAGWPENWEDLRAEEIAPEAYVRLANVLLERHQPYMER